MIADESDGAVPDEVPVVTADSFDRFANDKAIVMIQYGPARW